MQQINTVRRRLEKSIQCCVLISGGRILIHLKTGHQIVRHQNKCLQCQFFFLAPNLTFFIFGTLNPSFLLLLTYFHHWCHCRNAHWTKTLSVCGIRQCKAMQSHLSRMFKVVLFHFISVFCFWLFIHFSVILILSRVQWTIKTRLCFYGILKYACKR